MMQPHFRGFWVSVFKVVSGGSSSAFEFFEDVFNGIPVGDVLESESKMVTGHL